MIAQDCIDWLGYEIIRTGISPVNAEAHGAIERFRSVNLKQLRSFLRAVYQIIKFISNLAAISHPLRTVLKKTGCIDLG